MPQDSRAGKILYGAIENFSTNGVTVSTFHDEAKTYACEISAITMHRRGLTRGYLIDIRDVTEENRNLEILSDFNKKLNQEVAEKTQNIETIPNYIHKNKLKNNKILIYRRKSNINHL